MKTIISQFTKKIGFLQDRYLVFMKINDIDALIYTPLLKKAAVVVAE